MPRPNPVQNRPQQPRRTPPPPVKSGKFVVPKLTKEEKAARRANPHAAALATSRRGGLFRPTTRSDQEGKNKNGKAKQPRLILPTRGQITRTAPRDAEGLAANENRLRAQIVRDVEGKIQGMLPGAATARKLTEAIELMTQTIEFEGEQARARHDALTAELDTIFEAMAGDAAAVERIKKAIPARRQQANERAKANKTE